MEKGYNNKAKGTAVYQTVIETLGAVGSSARLKIYQEKKTTWTIHSR